MKPEWLRIVQGYPDNKVGPTIPFLLGALRSPVGEVRDAAASRTELRNLLVAMCDEAPAPWHVVIQPCGAPDKLVVALNDVKPQGFIRIASPSKSGRALYCYKIGTAQIHDVDSLAAALWASWGQSVANGDFSYDASGQWRPFSAKEKADIANTLKPDA